MKKHYVLLAGVILAATIQTQAQTKIGGAGAPDSSAMLEVTSGTGNNKGILLPRIPLANVTTWGLSGSTPVAGMFVYNTNASVTGGSGVGTYYWDGTQWVKSTSASTSGWNLTGNAGTNATTNFVGTTDAQPLVVRTNNIEAARFAPNGWLGIGTNNPALKLNVVSDNGGAGAADDIGIISYGSTTQPALVTYTARGTASAPANAQSGDFMGGAYFGSRVNGSNTLLSWVTSKYLGDGTTLKSDLEFNTNTIERMRIDSAGNVGIGTTTPVAKLDVNGTARISSSTGTPATITGRDATGNIGNVTLGAGLTLTGGTLSALATQPGWNLTGNAGTDSTLNFIGTTDARPLVMRTNNTEKLRVTANGNVGIGVAAPTAQLQLNNALAPRKLVLWNGVSSNPNRFFGFGVENLMMRYQVNNFGDDHVFFSGVTDSTSLELMRVKGNGNVGIGTATPGTKLAVAGNFGAFGGLSLTNSINATGITITPGYDMTAPAASTVTFDIPLTGSFVFGDNVVPSGAMQLGLTNRRWAGVNTQTLDADGIGRIGGSVPSNTITSITGRDATGNIGNITLGTGINLTAGVLSVPTPSVQLLQGTLVPNGANVGDTTTGWLSTGATITIPANSTYIVTADMILSTVPIGSSGGSSFVPAGQSLWVRSSFADAPTGGPSADLVGNNDLMSGTISAGMIYNMLHGAVTLSNTTSAPKTYYYIVGNVVSNGFTPTLYGFGATQWAENQIYAIPIN